MLSWPLEYGLLGGYALPLTLAKVWPSGTNRSNGFARCPRTIRARAGAGGIFGVGGRVEAMWRRPRSWQRVISLQNLAAPRAATKFGGVRFGSSKEMPQVLSAPIGKRKTLARPLPAFTCTFMIAQLSRQLSDEKLREKVLREMAIAAEKHQSEPEEADDYDAEIYEAGLEILELLKTGDPSEDRLERIDQRLAKVDESTRSAFSYFVGSELHALGKLDAADKYWRRALVSPIYAPCCATLAGNALAQRHETSRPDEDVLDQSDLWPARQDEGQKCAAREKPRRGGPMPAQGGENGSASEHSRNPGLLVGTTKEAPTGRS